MKVFSYFLIAVSALFIISCAGDPVSDWEEINLLEHGAAVKFKAPKTVKVRANNLMGIKDITVKDTAGDYNLQIYISDAKMEGITGALKEAQSDVEEETMFGEIVDTFPNGFIYNTVLDSSTTSYNFRYMEIKGNKQIEFMMGIGLYDLEFIKQTIRGIENKD